MGLTEQEIIRLAAEQAAKVTMETLEGQRKKAKKERRDWRLRNTRLLLDHLQRFRDHATQSVFDVRKVLESAQNDPQGGRLLGGISHLHRENRGVGRANRVDAGTVQNTV